MPSKYKQQLKLMLGYKFHKFLCRWDGHRALDVPWESLEINVDGVKVPICFRQPTLPQPTLRVAICQLEDPTWLVPLVLWLLWPLRLQHQVPLAWAKPQVHWGRMRPNHTERKNFRALDQPDMLWGLAGPVPFFMPKAASMVLHARSATFVIAERRSGGRSRRKHVSKEVLEFQVWLLFGAIISSAEAIPGSICMTAAMDRRSNNSA
mmetsp:Transcript_2786/g.4814  ORF Transcript_2786/g.4814 Transcript_2786/m.4814 type:complete len:207 (+) Transcript_2786:440-1060(+)